MTTTATPGTQAIDRAADLLLRLLESPEPRSLSALVDDTGLPKSTASRLLRALERNGLAERDEHGRFCPGPALVRYARSGAGDVDLVGLAGPHLRRLADATGETVNLGIPVGGQVEILAQIDSRYLLGGTNWVGMRVEAHASALGKVFQAAGVLPLPAGRLPRLAPRTVTDVARLLEELEQVRRRGFASTWEELEPGLVAVAAPVRGPGGAVIASVSVSAPTFRFTSDDVTRVGALVRLEADRLGERLGHRHQKEGAA